MKHADVLFSWHYQVTLIDRAVVEFSGWSLDIYSLQEILGKQDITISDSTLYRMKSERCYAIKPFLAEDTKEWTDYSKNKIGSFDKVAEWYIYISRSVKKFHYYGQNPR